MSRFSFPPALALTFALASLQLYAADAPPKTRLAEVEDVLPIRYGVVLTLDPARSINRISS